MTPDNRKLIAIRKFFQAKLRYQEKLKSTDLPGGALSNDEEEEGECSDWALAAPNLEHFQQRNLSGTQWSWPTN